MRQVRWSQRLAYLVASGALLALLLACSSGQRYTYIETEAPDGIVAGQVLDATAEPLAGVVVTAAPPSLSSPASTTTGADGQFELRAPAGEVVLTFSAAGHLRATQTVTLVANERLSLPALTLTAAP